MEVEVRFSVRCLRIAQWERVFVVGSVAALGNWLPSGALELQPLDSDRVLWVGSFRVPKGTNEVLFRYIIGYHLDAATEGSQKKMIISRWESVLHPRCCLPFVEATKNDVAREGHTDDFGIYNAKEQISDGWICNQEESVVLLRIHGEALKFYKQRYKSKEMRLKVVPFDVRFKESFCPYDARRRSVAPQNKRGVLWRLSSVYHHTKGSIDVDDCPEEERDPQLPDVPSFSNTELSVLTREDPIFGAQYDNGSIFRNNVDYLVFRTRTVSIEHLAFRIELFLDKERIGMAYALPAALPDTYGKSTFPIICSKHTPIGQLDVDYMLVKPLVIDVGRRDSMAMSYARHWRKRKTLEIGHRGMGNSYTKCASERENTIQSLKKAANKGADMVEFDVQLTKDLHPVIYHDFHVLVEVAGRNGKLLGEDDSNKHHEMALKDLKLAQLHLLHFEHLAHASPTQSCEKVIRVVPTQEERNRSAEQPDGNDNDEYPFPSLEAALKSVDPHVGFNIEVKYPMYMKDGTHECENYFERNKFVDTILLCVFTHCLHRRIIFSSFDPDICTLIAQKQHTFPVFFLVVGATTRYMPFRDVRSDCSRMAVHYAAATGLLGVNFHSEELLLDRKPLALAEKYGLVSFVWGDDLNQRENQEHFKNVLKVDGLIYDRIGEFEQRQNVFMVEKEAREALFRPSPAPSRRGSVERDVCKELPMFDQLARGPKRCNSQMQ